MLTKKELPECLVAAMKRKFFLSILIFLGIIILFLSGTYLLQQYRKQTQPPISIIIASDIHYLSPEYRGEYFREPSAIFDGKLTHYSPEYFDAFLAEVTQKQPEVLILSGDITLNGSIKSHEEVIEKLKKIQNSGTQVLVIPGNHDVNSTAGDYSPAEPVIVESASGEDFINMYETFGPAQAISRDEKTFSYMYEASPYLRFLMIDTNSLSKGSVEADTLTWIEAQLEEAEKSGADVIAITHQNLHIHNELLYFTYQLYNADKLLALYEKYDVKLNLSGHIHIQSIVSDATSPDITIPEVAVGSLAIGGTPYGELRYDGKTITYQTVKTDVSAYAASQNWADENLLNFNQYSIWYFKEVGRLQNYASLSEKDLSETEKDVLANTFADINSHYFLGEKFNRQEFMDGIELWRKQESDFISRYMETMFQEAEVENQNIIIDLIK